ncbi:DUF1803 domain-containing protein [Enterococcus sp. 5H]|uniref:DUF1803 domain-containing protein n=1 Tax=Enterococcus sp. 5H TaxID=1229490 RepID=UPI0023027BF6|nr:DUF1803 domain-containing protein [Enterococcus sp. 5H]
MVNDPLFQTIVDYFIKHCNQEIILRKLKTDIHTDTNLELFLDKLIKYKLIQRKDRRYSLLFPIFQPEPPIQISETIIDSLKIIIGENAETACYLFGEWFWSLLFSEERNPYFFGVREADFFIKREVGNDTWKMVSICLKRQQPLDLANFFTLLSAQTKLPDQFKPLQDLVGDVDINYFIPQLQKVIRSAKRQKVAKTKRDIFRETLLLTGDLIQNEVGEEIIVTPILENLSPPIELEPVLEELALELSESWKLIEDVNQRVFFKLQLFRSLFKECFPQNKSLHYFKNVK